MAGREKSKELSQRLNELDRISNLPDALISEILVHLPIKEAGRTSVLSTRWRNLWLWLPRLVLDSEEFSSTSTFVSFVDRFFDPDRVSSIDKLKLIADRYRYPCNLMPWIEAAIKRKVQRLHVHGYVSAMPLSLYTCETLVSLKLFGVHLPNAGFVSLPFLKTMRLKHIWYLNQSTFERLVSSCPVLEKLEIIGGVNDIAPVFRVLSKSLEKLIILMRYSEYEVVIDAPRLRFLIIEVNLSKSFKITNMDFNVGLSLGFVVRGFVEPNLLSQRNRLSCFLLRISKVRNMTTNGDTFRLLCEYSKLELLPQFGYMSRLNLRGVCYSYLKWLPAFLESCPNLKALRLVCYYAENEELQIEKKNQISLPSVPECLLSSLEHVDFDVPRSRLAPEMKVVRYFMENSANLKKLFLHWHGHHSAKPDFIKKLRKIPRRSTKCEVVILDW
ncbi:putative FBD-associated F-box protein At5g53635 [Eutrema salsugineum]|uniref:putative FBD-associated F-box protein At5g53635 n=1 Tax=Eutrema salsugineum TaxID=72664 RepID=UPI000CED07AA|nr:putative FBD-associated F-box protein At5g53635 [Eutrema salsugineum]